MIITVEIVLDDANQIIRQISTRKDFVENANVSLIWIS